MNGFGTIDKKDIDVLISSIENRINFIRNDINQNVTNLKNQLNTCTEELNRLKKLVIQVSNYNDTEYKKLENRINQFANDIEDIKSKLNTIQYNEIAAGKCASGINEYPIYAKYAENDINGNKIPDYYAAKSDLSNASATLSADYTEKIAESSSGGMSALSSVSGILTTNLERETQERINAYDIMNDAIVSETTRALLRESKLDTKIDEEISRSTIKDTSLEQKITTEKNRAETAESNLQEGLINETNRATAAENELLTNLNSEIERATDIESGLRTDLDNEITRATESETTIQTTLQENIDKEETRATNAETSLQANIDSEASLRESTDNTIQNNLSDEITRATGVEEELRTDLTAETTRATSVETTLTNNLTEEISNRETADRDLQSQIDTIEATQNVVDIVGTYAELEVYDTTHLKDNDKIQVLQDETEGGSTIYKWDKSKWSLIGEFGPYYTVSETDDLLNTKQNNLTAGDGIAITNDVVSHSIKIIENDNQQDTVEGTVFTVYLKNNHYKIITLSKTITEIIFMIEKSAPNVLQETGFEFTVPEDSELETLTFKVINDNNKKIYTIIPDSYSSPNIYQGTIVNYRCTIGEYEVED